MRQVLLTIAAVAVFGAGLLLGHITGPEPVHAQGGAGKVNSLVVIVPPLRDGKPAHDDAKKELNRALELGYKLTDSKACEAGFSYVLSR